MHELQGALCVVAQDVKAHEPLPRRNGEDGDLRPFERRDGYLLFLDARQRAADHGYDAFTSSLLISPYQNHELLKAVGETMGKKYGVEFYYRDFRPGFREGQAKAREMGLYMQKYCGCIFSEEDRYSTKIEKAKKRYAEE